MPKVPLSVQLLNERMINVELRNEISILRGKIEELDKKLISEKTTLSSYNKTLSENKAELEQIHQMLDAVPNYVARESVDENSYSRVQRNVMTRLAAWLAIR